MSLDFRHTCSEIDKEIENFDHWLKDPLSKLVRDVVYHATDEDFNAEDYITEYHSEIKKLSLECFETVRKLNEDMRDQANKQISDLEGEIEELKIEIDNLNDEVDSLTLRCDKSLFQGDPRAYE